jgi:hypothetical protein
MVRNFQTLKDRPGVRDPDGDRDRDEEREQQDQPDRGGEPVEQVLHQQRRTGERRLLDVQQGQALDRPDVHPGAGDVGELRRHDQVDPGALQLPGEPAQLATLGAGRAADRDRVGADLVDQRQEVPAGVDRDRGLDPPGGGVPVGEVDRHRDEPGRRAAADRPVDLQRLGERADQHHPLGGLAAVPAHGVQDDPGQIAGEHDQQQRAEQGRADRVPGQVGLGGEGEERDARRDRHRRPGHSFELVGAEPEVTPVVGAVGPEDDEPAERQQQVGDGMEPGGVLVRVAETGRRLVE